MTTHYSNLTALYDNPENAYYCKLNNPGNIARSQLRKQMDMPIEKFKLHMQEFLANGHNINEYCDDGNLLQIAILNRQYNNEILDYILSLPQLDPFFTPHDAYETIDECLFNKKNNIPQEVITKVLAAIDKKHSEYVENFKILIAIMYNNKLQFTSIDAFNFMMDLEIRRFNTNQETYGKIQILRN